MNINIHLYINKTQIIKKEVDLFMRIKALIILLLGLNSFFGYSQEPYSHKLNILNGLPSDAVYSILEDKKGFIWLTCNEGLVKYDGKNFFSYKAKNQNSFAGSALQQDRLGRIWYQNFDGQCYYYINNVLHALKGYQKGDYLEQFTTNDHLFVFENNAIVVFDIVSLKRIKTIDLKGYKDIPKFIVWNNEFYFFYNNWLHRITKNLEVKKIEKLPIGYLSQFKNVASNSGIFLQIKKGNHHEIWKYTSSGWTKKHVLDENLVIQHLAVIDDKLWVQTTKGTFVFEEDDVSYKKHFLSSKNLSNVIKDRKKNYWFTSPTEAIVVVPQFNNYVYDLNNINGIRFLLDESNAIISTQKDELVSLDLKSGKTTLKYKGSNNAEIYYLFKDPENETTIFVASDGNTYVVQNGDFKNPIIINQAIKQVQKIQDGLYCYVSSGVFGFIKINSLKNASLPSWLSSIEKDLQKEYKNITVYFSKSHLRCKALLYDSFSKSIYFSTTNGSFIYRDGKYTQIDPENSMVNFTSFFTMNKRVFGLGVNGTIYEIKPSLKCKKVSSEFGLENEVVLQIKLAEGKIIAKTNAQILLLERLNRNNYSPQHYFDRQNQSCFDFSLQDGYAWILTNNGLIRWDYAKEKQSVVNGKWLITDVSINSHSFDWKKKNEFSYSDNNLLLKFAVLDIGFQTIEKIQYRINDVVWVDIPMDVRTLNLPALSSGNHTIELRAQFTNGSYSSQQVKFTILKPFWKALWFYIIVFILLLSAVVLGFKHQIKQIQFRNHLMNEKINLESDLNKSLLASIKSQMNPHFIFNALNTIQAYIYMNDKANATGYLSKFSKLTRHILELSEKEKVQVSEEIKALELYLELEKMRFQEDFSYSICYEKIDISGYMIPSMLIQPYVENAIKHGLLHLEGKKELSVKFSIESSNLCIEIEDNGIGRKKSAEIQSKRAENHESFSSKANETRLKLLNNDQSVGVQILDKFSNDQQPLGTKVILTIKIKE